MGTIGKTHGVSSESAPMVMASQTNAQSEPCPIDPARLPGRGRRGGGADGRAAWHGGGRNARRAEGGTPAAGREPAPPARPSSSAGGAAPGAAAAGTAGASPAVAPGTTWPATSIGTSIVTVFGGRHMVSLQLW